MRALALGAAAGAVALTGAAPGSAPASADAPVVTQLVVFRDGAAVTKRVAARAATVRVGKRRCVAGAGTSLAALVHSHVGALGLRDYGSCSTRPRDSAGLFVSALRGERNKGVDGWVYKVGRKSASAGAADPTGAFGAGRLRSGARVTWFYCRMVDDGCQRTLSLSATPESGGVVARVTGYDDRGEGVPVDGATVHLGAATATTGPDGSVRVAIAPGRVRAWAEKDGLVRSFTESVVVP